MGKRDTRAERILAEVLSAAGVNERRVAVELLYLLPRDFTLMYEQVFHEAYSLGDEGRGGREEGKGEVGLARRKAGGKEGEIRGVGSGGGKKGSVFPVRNMDAVARKDWIDRQLRKITRAVRSGGGGIGDGEGLRCGWRRDGEGVLVKRDKGCGKFMEPNWNWCPSCGLAGPGGPAGARSRRAGK